MSAATATDSKTAISHVTGRCEDCRNRRKETTMSRRKIFTQYRVIVGATLLVLGFAFLGVVVGMIEPNFIGTIDSAGVRFAVLIGFPVVLGAVVLDQVRLRSARKGPDPDTQDS